MARSKKTDEETTTEEQQAPPVETGFTALIPVTVSILVPVNMPFARPTVEPSGVTNIPGAALEPDSPDAVTAIQAVAASEEVTAAFQRLCAAVASHRRFHPMTKAAGTLWLGTMPDADL